MKIKSLLLVILSFYTIKIAAQSTLPLKVATYNIRYENQGDAKNGNAWETRLPVIASIIRWESPNIFGAQEVLVQQLKDMKRVLPEYAAYGIGRKDGKGAGEYAPIFYKKSDFQLLKSGTFWLSETPEKPSKGWDAALPRICSWVYLKHKNTGKKIWFFNVHMDHVGVKARAESSRLVLRKMKAMVGREAAFLVGDFNVDQHNDNYKILNDSDYLDDAYQLAPQKMAWNGTYNAFEPNQWTASRIDHIFVTSNVAVDGYAVLLENYRRKNLQIKGKKVDGNLQEASSKDYIISLPSDHYPVFIKAEIALK